jgi:two-component system chemotaxis sensor kinase CheA
VRVASERLDLLVNLVGELVMTHSRIAQVSAKAGVEGLVTPVEDLERIVGSIRDAVLGIRMTPIGATFNRFKRLVHDLSAELGKEIDLRISGEETELDKTVLDQLGDPLVHLIRNCLDHGVERPEDRERLGKPRRAAITLSAVHTGANVVVAIADDGRGLDLGAIRAKAVERHLISAETVLSEKETIDLIFLPGFSTAKQLTSVSGRGVGMDVVRRQVEALRGCIQITTKAGQGTTVALSLPLTLAIIEGQLVEIGNDQFIVPMAAVAENVELEPEQRLQNNGRNVVAVRGDLISYIRLRDLFEIRTPAPELEKIVIVYHEGQRVGLVVDRVLGSHQTVIQSLGRFYRHIEVASGATIMGDGRVALILDIGGLVRVTGDGAAAGFRGEPAETTS